MKPKLFIRPMNIADIPFVYRIEKECFQYPWPKKEFFVELVRNRFAKYFVCFLDQQMLGFIGIWIIMDEAHIANIAVKKTYQKTGIGNTMMEFAENYAIDHRCKTMILEVGVANQVAVNFYEQRGYQKTHLRKNYYAHSFEDAYEMIKELKYANTGA
ncbi:MAG TPA: ribosomal protein S18-alanine N-acetyltransferase [Caldisericia bacterium]|nr:ribosomal protein S18-alanine N-acetyltransferase [Caldisericia bacterium]